MIIYLEGRIVLQAHEDVKFTLAGQFSPVLLHWQLSLGKIQNPSKLLLALSASTRLLSRPSSSTVHCDRLANSCLRFSSAAACSGVPGTLLKNSSSTLTPGFGLIKLGTSALIISFKLKNKAEHLKLLFDFMSTV
jgi:hypothetical protein